VLLPGGTRGSTAVSPQRCVLTCGTTCAATLRTTNGSPNVLAAYRGDPLPSYTTPCAYPRAVGSTRQPHSCWSSPARPYATDHGRHLPRLMLQLAPQSIGRSPAPACLYNPGKSIVVTLNPLWKRIERVQGRATTGMVSRIHQRLVAEGGAWVFDLVGGSCSPGIGPGDQFGRAEFLAEPRALPRSADWAQRRVNHGEDAFFELALFFSTCWSNESGFRALEHRAHRTWQWPPPGRAAPSCFATRGKKTGARPLIYVLTIEIRSRGGGTLLASLIQQPMAWIWWGISLR
jgi:hypothetical protein